jgi:hypothetical protein
LAFALTSVVVVDLGIGVLRDDLVRGREEHVVTGFARVEKATYWSSSFANRQQ